MCSIFGALVRVASPQAAREINYIMSTIYRNSVERGRDGRGFFTVSYTSHEQFAVAHFNLHREVERVELDVSHGPHFLEDAVAGTMLGNMRAEPTTEYVENKNQIDQQPYSVDGRWLVVHNGTIANDKELRAKERGQHPSNVDSAVLAELLANREGRLGVWDETDLGHFNNVIGKIKGSYAILATDSQRDRIFFACNYRPIWYIENEHGVFFGSTRRVFPFGSSPKMIEPYTLGCFTLSDGENGTGPLITKVTYPAPYLSSKEQSIKKALVVCSGGLDSVVSAKKIQDQGFDIELIHFQYGSRAEGPEVEAVKAVAEALGCKLTLFPLPVYSKKDSPLLDPDSKVAGGEAGAEFAHEWVPARNLLLLSVATAYAEANGFEALVLGNNLEEAGAYPDNEPEFIDRFNDLLPFAIGDGKKLRVIMPVGNMMKHEIVALGDTIGAPMHLTWSCYRAGKLHCGKCGPCFMRRTAFKINGLDEVISYEA